MRYPILFNLLLFAIVTRAQVPSLSMFYENIGWQIPSVISLSETPQVGLSSQLKQVAPQLVASKTLLFAEARKNASGLGLNYYGDFFDQTFQHAFQASFSRAFRLGKDNTLSLGLSPGAYLYQSTQGFLTERQTHFIYQIAAGFKRGNFLLGYSTGRRAFMDVGFSQNIYASYQVALADELFLNPLIHLFWFDAEPQLQTGARLSWNDWVDFGLIYQSDNGTNLTFGFNMFKNIRLGYAVVGLGSNLFTQYTQEFLVVWKPSSTSEL